MIIYAESTIPLQTYVDFITKYVGYIKYRSPHIGRAMLSPQNNPEIQKEGTFDIPLYLTRFVTIELQIQKPVLTSLHDYSLKDVIRANAIINLTNYQFGIGNKNIKLLAHYFNRSMARLEHDITHIDYTNTFWAGVRIRSVSLSVNTKNKVILGYTHQIRRYILRAGIYFENYKTITLSKLNTYLFNVFGVVSIYDFLSIGYNNSTKHILGCIDITDACQNIPMLKKIFVLIGNIIRINILTSYLFKTDAFKIAIEITLFSLITFHYMLIDKESLFAISIGYPNVGHVQSAPELQLCR